MSSSNARDPISGAVRSWAACVAFALIGSACGGGGGGGGGGGTGGGGTPPPPATYTVGGTISGLAGSGLVIQDNGGDSLTIAANATTFQFPKALSGGAGYAVTVATQPTGPSQTCTVAGGSGSIAAANVTNVSIACTTSSFTVGGTISGLTGSGLVLQDNGGDNLPVSVNATGFTFAQPVPSGAPYAVTVLTQPGSPSLTCTVTGGSGNVAAGNVTGIAIACAPTTYSVGGTITGLTSNGLVLRNNAGDDLAVAGNATTFTFKTALQTGTAYAVTVATQPSGPLEHCQVSNGSGSIAAANVTGIVIDCRVVGRFLYVTNVLDGVNPGNVTGFTINSADGTLTPFAAAVATDAKPSGIVVDPSGSFVYVSNTKTSDVSRFLVDPVSGVLTPRTQFVSKNTGGTAIAISPSDDYVFVGGYGPSTPTATGSLFGFSINPVSGSLTADPGSPYLADLLPQGLAVDPTSHFLFATGYQKHDVSAFAIGTPATTLLTEVASSPVNTGGNPYGVAVSPAGTADGGTIFVSDYGTGRVDVFFYDTLGNLTEAKNAPFPTGPGPKGLAVDPTGSYLYVANYDDGSVSSFSIGAKGQLTAIDANNSAVATGNLTNVANPGPIDVEIDPTGQFVYVVNQLDGSVSLFTASAGTLTLKTTYAAGVGATAAAIN